MITKIMMTCMEANIFTGRPEGQTNSNAGRTSWTTQGHNYLILVDNN